MSRVGSMPIEIPDAVQVSLSGQEIILKGMRQMRTFILHKLLNCTIDGGIIILSIVPSNSDSDLVRAKVLLGTNRSIIHSLICGLNKDFVRYLNIVGVGYKAESKGEYLTFHLGFSHLIKYKIPKGISVECTSSQIKISSHDVQKVCTVAAYLCNLRCYNPYKGKGIILQGKHMIRKEVNKKK